MRGLARPALPVARVLPRVSPSDLANRYAEDESGCWLWTGSVYQRQGYGRFNHGGTSYAAHRVVYANIVGPIPAGLVIDHLCRVRRCVNPEHLEPVTVQVNIARGLTPTSPMAATRVAENRCINGHDLASVGFHREHGGWTCAQCGRDRVRAYKQRKRASLVGAGA